MNDLRSQRFGMLTVLSEHGERARNGGVCWICKCDCGTFRTVKGTHLISGNTKSCGCARRAKDTLSKVHIQTLEMLFRGFETKEIAALRHRAPKTVEGSIGTLLRKAKARNSRELIYKAFERGWLQPPKRYVD